MPDFLETSFDHPKTAKVPLNALFFGPIEHFLVPLRNAKKIVVLVQIGLKSEVKKKLKNIFLQKKVAENFHLD